MKNSLLKEPSYHMRDARYQIVVFLHGSSEGITLRENFSVPPIKQAKTLCAQFNTVYIYDSFGKEGHPNYWEINAEGVLGDGVEI